MDAVEPHVRRRGFFLHSDTAGDADAGEYENPEGFPVRIRMARSSVARHVGSSRATIVDGRSRADAEGSEPLLHLRSATETGSRQRARLLR